MGFLRRKIRLLVLFMTFGSVLSPAQNGNGEIRGTVTDAHGAVIPNAQVTAAPIEKGEKSAFSRKTTTNADGEYVFAGLPSGIYDVRVDSGWTPRPFTKRIELPSNGSFRINLVISLSACSDEPENIGINAITDEDHIEIVRELMNLLIGATTKKEFILSPDNFSTKWLLPAHQSRITVLTRSAIQQLTERSGELTYYSITKPIQRGACVSISLVNNQTVKGQIEDANMAGGEETYEFRKVKGRWTGLLFSHTIS